MLPVPSFRMPAPAPSGRSFSFAMRKDRYFIALVISLLSLLNLSPSRAQATKTSPIEVMIVGFDHLSQLYNKQPESDVFSPKKQAELAKLRAELARFRPAAIMVEAERNEQPQLDSLYERYRAGQLALPMLPTGRSERYQIGFALAKQLGLPAPRGIDYYAATSQNLLSTGRNITVFQRELQQLQAASRPLRRQVQHDSLSLYDYIALANQPPLITLIHQALFNTPALVTSGTFSATGTNTVDLGKVDTTYIGAHYITLMYNRNLKIYSNILREQQRSQARRILVVLGLAHVKVQEELFADNPAYRVVHAAEYLKTKAGSKLRMQP